MTSGLQPLEKIKAVVLDMDGILVDTEPLHIESFRILLNDLPLDYDDAFLHSFVGHSVESNMTTIFQKLGKAVPEVINTELERREAIYLEILKNSSLSPQPGLVELMDACRRFSLVLALATSSVMEQVDVILDKISAAGDGRLSGFKDMLRVIVSGDQVRHKKPAPDIYQKVVQLLKIKPEYCMAVEDSPAGIRSAKAAGVYCIALQNRYWKREQLQEARADGIVESLNDLVLKLHK
jgi:beta-phosphoglucomutase-like phosphatase (HAD superfamily)